MLNKHIYKHFFFFIEENITEFDVNDYLLKTYIYLFYN